MCLTRPYLCCFGGRRVRKGNPRLALEIACTIAMTRDQDGLQCSQRVVGLRDDSEDVPKMLLPKSVDKGGAIGCFASALPRLRVIVARGVFKPCV